VTRRRGRTLPDDGTDAAVALLVAMLNAEVIPSVPCDVDGCRDAGTQYRNGIWCDRHLPVMEWLRSRP
jgi:hypothetical protein